MRTLYISETGRILLDENNTPHAVNHSREAVNNVFFLKEDTTVIYSKNGESKTINAKAGDIVVSFYGSCLLSIFSHQNLTGEGSSSLIVQHIFI